MSDLQIKLIFQQFQIHLGEEVNKLGKKYLEDFIKSYIMVRK